MFGGFAVFLWVRLLKDEVMDLSGAFDEVPGGEAPADELATAEKI